MKLIGFFSFVLLGFAQKKRKTKKKERKIHELIGQEEKCDRKQCRHKLDDHQLNQSMVLLNVR